MNRQRVQAMIHLIENMLPTVGLTENNVNVYALTDELRNIAGGYDFTGIDAKTLATVSIQNLNA